MSRNSDFNPIDEGEKLRIAEKMIGDIKAVCPRFSIPHEDEDFVRLIRIWARAIFFDREYPRFIYDEAIAAYANTASRDDNPPMPGDILRNCKIVMDKAVADPVKGGIIADWRDSRAAYRESLLNGA